MPWTTVYLFFICYHHQQTLLWGFIAKAHFKFYGDFSFILHLFLFALPWLLRRGRVTFNGISKGKIDLKLIHDNLVANYRVAVYGLLSLLLFLKAILAKPFVSCFYEHGILCVDRFSNYDVIDLALVLLNDLPWISYWSDCSCCFFHGINKLYSMTFYNYHGCSIVVTILLYLLILIMLMGLYFGV